VNGNGNGNGVNRTAGRWQQARGKKAGGSIRPLGAEVPVGVLSAGLCPPNILLDALHTRRGLKRGVPAMLLAVSYPLAAVFSAGATGIRLTGTDGCSDS